MIIDGGTLEHVGNMAAGLSAAWEGLSKGGYYVGGYPINNLCDHGYWQPQPRFFADFFRINNAAEINIQIVKFDESETSRITDVFPYQQGATGQMIQPDWAECKGQLGVFMIIKKSIEETSSPIKFPSDF